MPDQAAPSIPDGQQKDKTPFAPRCVKDRIEEELFAHRRDLFTDLQLVFFNTTSISFEGYGVKWLNRRDLQPIQGGHHPGIHHEPF